MMQILNLLILSAGNQFWNWLKDIDQSLFILINSKWTAPFLDNVLPFLRQSNTWLPFYLFLGVFVLLNFKWKAFPWILFFVLTITLSDQISSALIKPLVMRLRPCIDPDFSFNVRLLVNRCSGGYSFTSSHATNHFGMATFLAFTLKPYFGNRTNLIFLWAASISYSQVYVGVHYPIDILSGALLGTFIGFVTSWYYNKNFKLQEITSISTPELH